MAKINPARIIFEDEHLLAVNKLPRELAVAGKDTVVKLSLLDFLRTQYGTTLKPLHRLDFDTSGVLSAPIVSFLV
jgi:23S rRNA-/tRNA-specific pseudouridylate synthase